MRTNRVLKKSFSWFDKLTTNGKRPIFPIGVPFALSPSTPLRAGLSKPVVSFIEPGERRVFQHPAKSVIVSSSVWAVVVIATMLLAGCGDGSDDGAPPSGASPDIVIIANASQQAANAYSPSPFTVSLGSTVIWKNTDTTTHTVTSDSPGEFDSGNMTTGETFFHIFMTEGTFDYRCAIPDHNMAGKIIVVP